MDKKVMEALLLELLTKVTFLQMDVERLREELENLNARLMPV